MSKYQCPNCYALRSNEKYVDNREMNSDQDEMPAQEYRLIVYIYECGSELALEQIGPNFFSEWTFYCDKKHKPNGSDSAK